MKNLSKYLIALFAISAIVLNSCQKEDDPEPVVPKKPWEVYSPITGNFSINSKEIVGHGGDLGPGSYSKEPYLEYYILRNELPLNTQFEYYTIRVYIPSNDQYEAGISGYGLSLFYDSQNLKERIPGDENLSSVVDVVDLNGYQYSVFEIVVRDTKLLANMNNINQMIFVFYANYSLRSDKSIVHTELVNVEIDVRENH